MRFVYEDRVQCFLSGIITKLDVSAMPLDSVVEWSVVTCKGTVSHSVNILVFVCLFVCLFVLQPKSWPSQ